MVEYPLVPSRPFYRRVENPEGIQPVFFDLDGTLVELPEDFFAVFEAALTRHGLAEEFAAVVVSGEVGAGNPDPEIFATATEAIPADGIARADETASSLREVPALLG